MEVKLWGVLKRLSIAWRLGEHRILLEIGSVQVINMMWQGRAGATMGSLFLHILDLLDRWWEVKISHVFCEANVTFVQVDCNVLT
ncbi:hypothetical protein V6N13_124383 [Hibiscus sabdariffa]